MSSANEHIQMWSPDTCGCSFHQAVDRHTLGTEDVQIRFVSPDEAAQVFDDYRQRNPNTTHKLAKSQWLELFPSKLCDVHTHHGHTQARYDAATEENQRKNHVVNLLQETTGVKPTEFRFQFDSDRVLTVVHPSLTAEIQKQVDSEIETKHGKGRVKLNG